MWIEWGACACHKGAAKFRPGASNVTSKQLAFGLVAIAIAGLGLAAYFVFWGNSSDEDFADLAKMKVVLSAGDHTLGDKSAPVQMVEYAAPVCPVCARWDMTVFPSFKPAYVDTGKVLYVFRVFPLRSVDLAVEGMARCLPKQSYFQFIDMMYRNQPKWDPDGYDIPDEHAALVGMGKVAGMSASQVDSCTNNHTELQKASAIGEYANKTYGINSTPSFIIDGVFHQQDVMTWADLQDVLNGELSKKSKQS